MHRRFPDECIDPLRELEDVLAFSGIRYLREEDSIRFAFSDSGYEWETTGRPASGMLLLYGIYPFHVEEKKLLLRVNTINATLANGSLFVSEGRLVLRTGADLFDAYSAQEAVTRALEYNAGAVVRFWPALRAAAE